MKKHTTTLTSKSIEQSGLPQDFKKAITEFIWNGFDAKASVVELNYDANEVGFINSFSITDNGVGIDINTIDETFGHFLDSKKNLTFDLSGYVKGKKGKGRFSFGTFCNTAQWETTFKTDSSEFLKYNITINREKFQDFSTSNQIISTSQTTGTTVNFSSFFALTGDLLDSKEFVSFLASEFGWFLFLNKEFDFKLIVNHSEIDYRQIIDDYKEVEKVIGHSKFNISFIRWKENIGDKYYYYFLNQSKKEVERKYTSFNNKAIEFHHSVFIVSDYFNDFTFTKVDYPTLGVYGKNQSETTFKQLLRLLNDIVSEEEKIFVRGLKASKLIEDYNSKNVFPQFRNNSYEQHRKKDLEEVVKEIYCIQPKIFQGLKTPQSKTLVGFLNLLLDTEQRENILSILENIVSLTDEERQELSKVLRKTKLNSISAIINLLTNRFEVVNVLKTLVFELEKFTNEREHIQKIIENNYWLFGEQYHLVSADKHFEISLNNYLDFIDTGKKHKEKLITKDKLKRPDIFISRQFDIIDTESNDYTMEENIIVELKRPSVIIGKAQFDQIEEYIRFIINEPKFISQLRKWKLILIGKQVDEWIKDRYESNKSKGNRFLVEAVRNYEIYAMTWDDLFKVFDNRHKHFINKLEFKSSIIDDLEHKGIILDFQLPDELVKAVGAL